VSFCGAASRGLVLSAGGAGDGEGGAAGVVLRVALELDCKDRNRPVGGVGGRDPNILISIFTLPAVTEERRMSFCTEEAAGGVVNGKALPATLEGRIGGTSSLCAGFASGWWEEDSVVPLAVSSGWGLLSPLGLDCVPVVVVVASSLLLGKRPCFSVGGCA